MNKFDQGLNAHRGEQLSEHVAIPRRYLHVENPSFVNWDMKRWICNIPGSYSGNTSFESRRDTRYYHCGVLWFSSAPTGNFKVTNVSFQKLFNYLTPTILPFDVIWLAVADGITNQKTIRDVYTETLWFWRCFKNGQVPFDKSSNSRLNF
jgi:hypothetical protein